MAGLPMVRNEEALEAVGRDEAALRPGVERLGRLLSLNLDDLSRYPAESRPVYACGDLVLKLFPPVAGWPDHRIEAQVLSELAGRLPRRRMSAPPGSTTAGATC